ncbi:hypothetical protein chiPu_0027963, partial [Chiloscyllium punctatum]|nr:hypothetical protein [Chiloscyllium punctatum]
TWSYRLTSGGWAPANPGGSSLGPARAEGDTEEAGPLLEAARERPAGSRGRRRRRRRGTGLRHNRSSAAIFSPEREGTSPLKAPPLPAERRRSGPIRGRRSTVRPIGRGDAAHVGEGAGAALKAPVIPQTCGPTDITPMTNNVNVCVGGGGEVERHSLGWEAQGVESQLPTHPHQLRVSQKQADGKIWQGAGCPNAGHLAPLARLIAHAPTGPIGNAPCGNGAGTGTGTGTEGISSLSQTEGRIEDLSGRSRGGTSIGRSGGGKSIGRSGEGTSIACVKAAHSYGGCPELRLTDWSAHAGETVEKAHCRLHTSSPG